MAILPGIRPAARATNGMRPKLKDGAQKSLRFSFRGALKYGFLPGFMPRIRRFGEHFGIFAQMLAMILSSAGLLPKGHPMLNPVNLGRFGITDVLAAAANNIVVKRENIDKILIFGAIVLSLIMIVVQTVVIAFYSFIGSASAQGTTASTSNMFTTATPEKDVVFRFLQQTIGLPGFFNDDKPIGFSIAEPLRDMLAFYSTGMMLIAVIIVCYYVITIAGESAQTGQAFGKRFNSLWAPIRLVLALGLLVPLGSGLNAAQYLTLHVAKAGSSFATNAWQPFFKTISNAEKTVVPAYPTGMSEIGKRIFLSEVCRASYNRAQRPANLADPAKIVAWIPGNFDGTTTAQLKAAFPAIEIFHPLPATQDKITIEWGEFQDDTRIHTTYMPARTAFSCGKLTLTTVAPKPDETDTAKRARLRLQNDAFKAYAQAISKIVEAIRPAATQFATAYVLPDHGASAGGGQAVPMPSPEILEKAIKDADDFLMKELITKGRDTGQVILDKLMSDMDPETGWGSASVLYIKIAYANLTIQSLIREAAPAYVDSGASTDPDTALGTTVGSNHNDPLTRWYAQMGFNEGSTTEFNPTGQLASNILNAVRHASTTVVEPIQNNGRAPLTGSYHWSDTWKEDGGRFGQPHNAVGIFKDLFGVTALETMADPDYQNIFPMVHLVNLGNELINKAMYAFVFGVAASVFSGAIGSMIFTLGFIGLGIGFLLGIVLPFMPFIYFFFAIVEWVMGVVEALVGVPLWALAHLRIDGEGMPGQAAMNGYYIFLGMLIKPFLILFSLFASFIIFNAGASFLNDTFGSAVGVIGNAGAAGVMHADATSDVTPAGPIQFVGYLIVYAVIIYNLGLVSFKLIDTIPAQTMRWIGQSNLNFNDQKPDPIGGVSNVALTAGSFVGSQLAGRVAESAAVTGRTGIRAGKAGLTGINNLRNPTNNISGNATGGGGNNNTGNP